jgi:ArsR family metal-binding transcriptional regulator
MGEALRTAHGIFPGSIYYEDLKVLIFKVARATVTIYSTGNMALSMVSNENETNPGDI